MNIKKKKRQIAENRVGYLAIEVEKSLKDNYNLAEIQAKQAREFSKKFNIKSGFSRECCSVINANDSLYLDLILE